MGAATGPATPGSSDAPGDCTPRCRRPPRPRRTTRQQTTTEMSETSYGTAQAGAQTLAAGNLRDFRVPFDREAEFVRLAGGFAVEGKVPYLARAPPLHLLLHPGVGDHELTVVEEVGQDRGESLSHFDRQGVDFCQRFGKAVRDLDVLGTELPHELQIMVAWYAQGRAMDDHVSHQPDDMEDVGTTVHEVAQEHHSATLGMHKGPVAPERIVVVQAGLHVAESSEESVQFLAAPVDIADDVERAVLVPLVVPQRNSLDNQRLNLLGRVEH